MRGTLCTFFILAFVAPPPFTSPFTINSNGLISLTGNILKENSVSRDGTSPKSLCMCTGKDKVYRGAKPIHENVKKAFSVALAGCAFFAPLAPLPTSSPLSSGISHSSPVQPVSAAEEERATGALLDEVSSYVNKYYVDRTFNGQDRWPEIVQEAKQKLQASDGGSKAEFKAAQELLKTLGDKYTRILPADLYERLTKYDLVGVGAMLGPSAPSLDGEKYLVVGAPPVPGSSAFKAGIKKGDLVTSINGKSTLQMTAFDVIDLTSNDQSPTMRFSVQKPGEVEETEYVLERIFNKIEDPVQYFMEKEKDGHRVGYIKLKEFNSLGKEKVREAVQALEKQGVDRYVLDLRGNGGGAFQSAIGISGLFMDSSPVVSIVDGYGARETFRAAHNQVVTDKPLVVWIDGKSASASEVLSGALHDNCRAMLVGTQSFGKGLIQAVYGLNDGGGLVMTVAKYETPRGTDINKIGLKPDSEISPSLFKIPGSKPDFSVINFDKAIEMQKTCPAIEN